MNSQEEPKSSLRQPEWMSQPDGGWPDWQFDGGYLSPDFITDVETAIAALPAPYFLIYDQTISDLLSISPLLGRIRDSGSSLLIIAGDVDGDAIETLIMNKQRAGLQVAAVRALGFADERKEMLDDLAALTGGRVVSEDRGLPLERVTLAHLGRAKHVEAYEDSTTIIGASAERLRKGRMKRLWPPSIILNGSSGYVSFGATAIGKEQAVPARAENEISKQPNARAERRKVGRPTSMPLVLMELRRRAEGGLLARSAIEQAEHLSEWLSKYHPAKEQLKPDTIRLRIADEFKALQTASGQLP